MCSFHFVCGTKLTYWFVEAKFPGSVLEGVFESDFNVEGMPTLVLQKIHTNVRVNLVK